MRAHRLQTLLQLACDAGLLLILLLLVSGLALH